MRPKIVTTEQSHFIAGQWAGANESGWNPIGDSILILPDEASEKIGKSGLLVAPANVTERQSLASETGLVIAVGEGAYEWNADRTRPFKGRKPEPGDHVCFARYAGRVYIGDDGKSYRVMTDNCVAAIKG